MSSNRLRRTANFRQMECGRQVVTRDEHRDIIAFIDEAVRPDESGEPLDVEADAIIRALFVRNPEAAYRITKLAMAQRSELESLRTELADANEDAGKNWLSRLLKKQARQQRSRRLDPNFSMFPQDLPRS
jgi:hypothetical protein